MEYSIAILFVLILFLLILLIIYPYILKFIALRNKGMSYGEIYRYMRFIFLRESSINAEENGNNDFQENVYIIPKKIEPYVFYCSHCDITSVGYEVLCPICGDRMNQPKFNLIKSNSNDSVKCVLCHSKKCPICNLELNGEVSCIQDCPYCESIYHLHCWIMTMEKFGKCGQCLEKPPPDYDKMILLTQQKLPNENELMIKFETETGKKAIWGNRITKNYLIWKEKNYP